MLLNTITSHIAIIHKNESHGRREAVFKQLTLRDKIKMVSNRHIIRI